MVAAIPCAITNENTQIPAIVSPSIWEFKQQENETSSTLH